MPKVIKKHTDKKEQEEDFKETIGDLRERLKDKQRTLVYALIAFVLVIGAVGSFVMYQRIASSRAAELEYEGYKVFYGDLQTSQAAPADRYQKALELFKESYGKRKNPTVFLYIANCYYELGKYDEAIKTLTELNDRYTDPQIVPLSYLKLAMAYLMKNDQESALTALKNLYSIKSSPLQDVALLESGKILESQGKSEEAKAKYRELVSKFPKSPLINEAKTRLGEK